MRQGTSGDQVHLFEQPVQQDETIAQKQQQQQSQIPMGQGALMELQQQIQQSNLQMQLMEQMRERLLEPQVQKEKTQQEQQQQQQTVMGQGTRGNHLLEQPVQLDEHIEQQQQQQQSQIPVGQVALLDFFEPSSQRLPLSPEQTTVDDYEDDI
jgi:hypothetical protein